VRLAHCKSADRVSRKINVDQLPSAVPAQIRKRRALRDSELPLRQIAILPGAFAKIISGAYGPCGCSLQRGFGFVARSRRLNAFVEHHGDVRAKRELNLSRFFRRQKMLGAIEVGLKTHAFIGDFAKVRKTENLVAAGIGKNRAVPRHEFVQAAESADEQVAGAEAEMIRIAENDLCAELLKGFIAQTFYGGLRSYRHENGRLNGPVRCHQAATARSARIRA
jgi:hypothetical protein